MMDKPRKWDDQTPRSSEMCLKAAKEAAAKVFSRLLAEGKVDPNSKDLAQPPPIIAKKEDAENKNHLHILDIPLPSTDSQALTCEVEINDIAYSCRNLLTKSVTQDDIFKVSGAKVATRGRFMTPEEKEVASGEKPLYLSVQGQTQHNVEVAVQRISGIIQSMCNIPPSSLTITSGTTNVKTLMNVVSLGVTTHLAFVQDKLFVGLEHAPHNFDVKQKILGPNGSYLQHIQSETGAKVMLKGKGSGFIEPTSGREAFEPMFIYLQHANQLGLQHAKKLAQNLLETVQKEYANFQQALAMAPPSINPGTASMLAGLQQSAAFPPNGQLWNTPLRSGYNSVYQYPCQMPGGAPFGSYQPPLEGPMIDSNGGGMFGYQAPPTLSMYGVPGMMLPPPPPPLPATTNQISSVSALSYYDRYIQSTNQTQPTDRRPSDEPVTDGRTAKVQRRRFQEKLEEEKNDDDDDDESGTSECKDKATTSVTASIEKKDKEDFKVPSHISTAKDEDGFVRPPPLVALKRKRPDSDLPTLKAPLKVLNNPGGLQGALKSVAACYGSESEDEDNDNDNDGSV